MRYKEGIMAALEPAVRLLGLSAMGTEGEAEVEVE